MQSSETCRAMIMEWEGLRTGIYLDANGNPTIGYGHKLTGAEVESGLYVNGITAIDAETLFDKDIAGFEAQVTALGCWTQGQYDALTSFIYNLGIYRLRTMLRHGIDQVPEQLPRWVYASGQGKILPGLVARRAQEVIWWKS